LDDNDLPPEIDALVVDLPTVILFRPGYEPVKAPAKAFSLSGLTDFILQNPSR